MIKIAVGGAIDKMKIVNLIKSIGGEKVSVQSMTDIQAAMAVKNGTADYYLGACATGGGGALALAIAILGANRCATVSMPGKSPIEEDIIKAMEQDKVAFGFTNEHIEKAVPIIMNLILKKGAN